MWLPATDNHVEAHNNVLKNRVAAGGQQALTRVISYLSEYMAEVSASQDPGCPSFDKIYAEPTRAPTPKQWEAAEKVKSMKRIDIPSRDAILFSTTRP